MSETYTPVDGAPEVNEYAAEAERQRGVFARAPEVQAARSKRSAEPSSQPSVREMAHALQEQELREEAELLRIELEETRNDSDFVNAYSLIGTAPASEVAGRVGELVDRLGIEDSRAAALVDGWQEADPSAAQAWLQQQHQRLSSQLAREEAVERQREADEQNAAIASAVDDFRRRHPEAREGRVADALLTAVAAVVGADGAAAMPDRIDGTLAATKATTRAADRAQAENDFRSEFRRQAAISSGVFGSAARKHLQEGELGLELKPESRPAAVTEDDIARRLPAHLRGVPTQGQREREAVKSAIADEIARRNESRADIARSESLRRHAEAERVSKRPGRFGDGRAY
jgi:hypothetical protein